MDSYRTGYIDGEASRDPEVEGLKQQLAEREKHHKEVSECHAIDLRERDAAVKSWAEAARSTKKELAERDASLLNAISEIHGLGKQIAELEAERDGWQINAEQWAIESAKDLKQQLAAKDALLRQAHGVIGHVLRCIPINGFAQIHYGSATAADLDEAIAAIDKELK
jgi:chromosome segregation ATPase